MAACSSYGFNPSFAPAVGELVLEGGIGFLAVLKSKGLLGLRSAKNAENARPTLRAYKIRYTKSAHVYLIVETYMPQRRFSERNGFARLAGDITIVEDAPSEVRDAVLNIAEGELDLRPTEMRTVLCRVLRKMPDSFNWSDYPNVWGECQTLIGSAPWYRVYEFIESLYETMMESGRQEQALRWAELINNYFLEAGVGWRLVDGQFERRESEAFVAAVDDARAALLRSGQQTARDEIQEALRDISRRPEPDLTGAVQHAIAALECTAREATGDRNATLGDILNRYPDIVPRPLDTALVKIWGYASEFGRHLREGRQISEKEAALVVTISAAVCTFLAGVGNHQ